MNFIKVPGEFQEVESNLSARLSYVPSQPPAIPSSRSMLSRDKRLPLDTWNTSGPQEKVFGNQFSTFDSSRNHFQGIHHSVTPGAAGSIPAHIGTGDSGARDEDLTWCTFPMPTFARRQSNMSSSFPVDIPQNSVVGQQRQQISELHVDKFPTSFYIIVFEDKIQKPK